jgi:hypothetical protein
MQDPLTAALEIRRPWPRRDTYGTKTAARHGVRWQARRHHPLVLAGRAFTWPPLATVWHRDPTGVDSTTCPIYPGHAWRFHIHHWRLQVHPLQRLRRQLLTRCEVCGGRSTKGNPVNLSTWNRKRGPWWRGEQGLAHMACKGVAIARPTT